MKNAFCMPLPIGNDRSLKYFNRQTGVVKGGAHGCRFSSSIYLSISLSKPKSVGDLEVVDLLGRADDVVHLDHIDQALKKRCSAEGVSDALGGCSAVLLLRRDVAVDVLRADEGVEEQVAHAGDDHPVTADEAHFICHKVLDERDDASTADECHEDARRQRGVFA